MNNKTLTRFESSKQLGLLWLKKSIASNTLSRFLMYASSWPEGLVTNRKSLCWCQMCKTYRSCECMPNIPLPHSKNLKTVPGFIVTITEQLTKKWGQNPAILTEQAWPINYLLYGFWGNFPCGTTQLVMSRQTSTIFPPQVVNHSTGFGSTCLCPWS